MRTRRRVSKSETAPTTSRITEGLGGTFALAGFVFAQRAHAEAYLPIVERFEKDATIADATVPYVLTAEAVAKGHVPPLGTSGLPPSLESSVPASLRFWKAADADAARVTQRALVESSMFEGTVLVVNGAPHRTVTQTFLAVEDDVEAELSKGATDVEHGVALLAFDGPEIAVIDCRGGAADLDVAKARESGRPWLALLDAEAAISKAVKDGANVYRSATRPGFAYATDVESRGSSIASAVVAASKALARARLVKSEAATDAVEERIVFGIVLEPDVVDSQKDTYSAAEIRKAAFGYMENFAQVGLQHAEIVTGRVKILESYVAPADFTIDAIVVKAGTWLMTMRVSDDELWAAVKNGSFTGFSIGGTAVRTPESNAA